MYCFVRLSDVARPARLVSDGDRVPVELDGGHHCLPEQAVLINPKVFPIQRARPYCAAESGPSGHAGRMIGRSVEAVAKSPRNGLAPSVTRTLDASLDKREVRQPIRLTS